MQLVRHEEDGQEEDVPGGGHACHCDGRHFSMASFILNATALASARAAGAAASLATLGQGHVLHFLCYTAVQQQQQQPLQRQLCSFPPPHFLMQQEAKVKMSTRQQNKFGDRKG